MINLKAVCRLPFASLLIRRNFSLLALFVVLSLILTACSNGSTDSSSGEGGTFIPEYSIDDTGPGGGKIIYVSTGGFTVTGTGSFTAHYLEAAPANMATNLKWCSHTGVPWCDVTTGTAIGTGKANTAAIIAAHSGDTVANNAAKACAEYSNNGKTDWFLPSKDELKEMYNARTHVGISSGVFWSSSQNGYFVNVAWDQDFDDGYQGNGSKNYDSSVRAVRAF